MFRIRSISTGRELIFSPSQERNHFHVELKSFEVSAFVDMYQNPWNENLSAYFGRLASFRHPWQGIQEWWSEDGVFKISAQSTLRGHVLFRVKFGSRYVDFDEAENWEVEVGLETLLGELDIIAQDANAFFKEVGSGS